MVKTQIFIVCDKCEKPFKDTDAVYGYAVYDDHRIAAYSKDEKNYTDYYFDEECFENMKTDALAKLKSTLTDMILSKVIKNEIAINIPYIRQRFKFYKMEFNEADSWYFAFSTKDTDQLIRVTKDKDNGWKYHCFNDAIDLIFKDFKYGLLSDLRKEFKEEGNRRKLASQTACSVSALDCCSTSGIVEAIGTTKAYI